MLPRRDACGYFGEDCSTLARYRIVSLTERTGKRLHEHGKRLSGDVQICPQMHDADHFRDEGILRITYSAPEPDNRDNTRRIPLKMGNIVIWSFQQIVGNHFALVILEAAVALYLLDPDSLMHELSLDAEALSLCWSCSDHVDEVVLA